MDTSLNTMLSLLLCGCLWGAWGQTKIDVNNGGIWGTWGEEQSCPNGSYATGFSLKVELPQMAGDNTALNGIRLLCSSSTSNQSNVGLWGQWTPVTNCTPGSRLRQRVELGQGLKDDTAANNIEFYSTDGTELNGIQTLCSNGTFIQSNVGPWGNWTSVKNCPPGSRLTQFRLRVEPCQGLKDDTAANNIEFYCTDGTELKGDGGCWGKWGCKSRSCGPQGICTIATKVEVPQGKGDDTALNDVYFKCCKA